MLEFIEGLHEIQRRAFLHPRTRLQASEQEKQQIKELFHAVSNPKLCNELCYKSGCN